MQNPPDKFNGGQRRSGRDYYPCVSQKYQDQDDIPPTDHADAVGPGFPQGRAHQYWAITNPECVSGSCIDALDFPTCFPDLNPIKPSLDTTYRLIRCRHIMPGAE